MNRGIKSGPGLIVAPALVAEAAGVEPASANAPSVRFYEHSSRFSFALLCEPGHRGEASPLGFPLRALGQDPEGKSTNMTPVPES